MSVAEELFLLVSLLAEGVGGCRAVRRACILVAAGQWRRSPERGHLNDPHSWRVQLRSPERGSVRKSPRAVTGKSAKLSPAALAAANRAVLRFPFLFASRRGVLGKRWKILAAECYRRRSHDRWPIKDNIPTYVTSPKITPAVTPETSRGRRSNATFTSCLMDAVNISVCLWQCPRRVA